MYGAIAPAALRSKPARVADRTRSWLLVLPMRLAGGPVLVVAGKADVSTATTWRARHSACRRR